MHELPQACAPSANEASSIGALLSFIVMYYWLLVCTFAVQLLREEPLAGQR